MKNKIKQREWLYRALRTAGQAAVAAIAANLVAWVNGITDIASAKNVLISASTVIGSAILSALMNMNKDGE